MTIHLEGITVVADDVAALAEFYERALGWEAVVREESYVAFGGHGVRFTIFSRRLMGGITGEESAYAARSSGRAFELNLQCDTAEEVERYYDLLIAAGATPTRRPGLQEWGQYAGFFADPEGNTHSLFANV